MLDNHRQKRAVISEREVPCDVSSMTALAFRLEAFSGLQGKQVETKPAHGVAEPKKAEAGVWGS